MFALTRSRYIEVLFHFTIPWVKKNVHYTKYFVIQRFVISRFHCIIYIHGKDNFGWESWLRYSSANPVCPRVCQTFEFLHLQIVLKWEAKKKKKKKDKRKLMVQKVAWKAIGFYCCYCRKWWRNHVFYKSCRVGFAPLPVANGYVRKIMLVSCYVITLSCFD